MERVLLMALEQSANNSKQKCQADIPNKEPIPNGTDGYIKTCYDEKLKYFASNKLQMKVVLLYLQCLREVEVSVTSS